MRTTLAIIILFLVLFCVMVLVAVNCEPRLPGGQAMGLALEWTLHVFGGVVASTAAVGMLLVAAQHGSLQRQFVLVPPLLGGLLLIDAHWGLAVALGGVVAIWMFRWGPSEADRSSTKP